MVVTLVVRLVSGLYEGDDYMAETHGGARSMPIAVVASVMVVEAAAGGIAVEIHDALLRG